MKEDFFNNLAKFIWEDFNDDSESLSENEIKSLKEQVIEVLTNKELVFYNDNYKRIWDFLVEENIVEPMWKSEVDEKKKIILG